MQTLEPAVTNCKTVTLPSSGSVWKVQVSSTPGADHFSSDFTPFLIGFLKLFSKHLNIILSFKHSLQKKHFVVTFEGESISPNALRDNVWTQS